MMTDEIISIRLDWDRVCKLACMAMWMGITFDAVIELAMRERLERMRKP